MYYLNFLSVHYYNIRSYLEYTNRLTALHWSRRKKGTEAHMSGIFQNIEPRRRRRPLRHLGYTCRLSLTLLGTTLLWWLRQRRTGEQTDWLDWLWLLVQSPIQLLPCSLHCSFSDGLLTGSHWGHGSQCGEPLRLPYSHKFGFLFSFRYLILNLGTYRLESV